MDKIKYNLEYLSRFSEKPKNSVNYVECSLTNNKKIYFTNKDYDSIPKDIPTAIKSADVFINSARTRSELFTLRQNADEEDFFAKSNCLISIFNDEGKETVKEFRNPYGKLYYKIDKTDKNITKYIYLDEGKKIELEVNNKKPFLKNLVVKINNILINIINIKKYKDLIKSVIVNIIKENGINTFGTQAMFFLEMLLKDNSKFILFIDPSQSKLEELPEEINEIAINEKLTGKFILPYINSQHNVSIVLDINQSNQLDNIEILDSLQSSFKDIEYYRPFIGFFNSQSQNSAKDKIKFINSSKNERFQSNKKTANSCYFLSAQSTEYLCDMLEEIEKTDKKIEMVDKSTQTYKFDIAQMQERIVNRLNEYREYGINIGFENYELLDYSEANRPSAVATHGSEFLPQTNMFKVPNKAKPKKSEEKLDNRNKLVDSIIQKHQDTNKSSLEMAIQREYDKNSSQSD